MADVSSNPVVDWGGLMAGAQLQRAQTGLTQQQTALAQQQAQAAQMANQVQRARMPLIMNALSDYADSSQSNASGVSPSSGSAPAAGAGQNAPSDESGVDQSPETSWYDPKNIDAGLRQQYFVPPVLPGEAKSIQRAAIIGDPGLLENAKMQRQFRVDQQTAASQYGANNMYEAIHTVVDAAPGTAMAQLEAIAPNTVKKIREQIPDAADEDAAARAYAAHVGGVVHQYTGRKSVPRADGTYVDEVTGRPIPGVEKSGLTEDQWAGLAKAGNNLVDMNDGQGHVVKVPQWRANGAPDLQSWVMQQAAHGGDFGSQPTIGGAPKAVATKAAQAGIASAAANAPAATPGEAKDGTTTTNGQPDPVMSKALADPDYKFVSPSHKFGTALSPDEQNTKNKQSDAAVSLKEDLNKGVPATQQALTFYKAAQDILDSKGANTGKWATVLAHAGAWVPGMQVPAASNYQELAKYLGNAALNAGKSLFPKMTQKEGDWILNKLNPSPNMNEDAVRNMIQTGVGMSQYTLDSAKRVGAYLRTGGDATRFQDWNSHYWPMTDVIKTGNGATAPTQKYTDAQIAKWAEVHKVDPAKARAFLLGSK